MEYPSRLIADAVAAFKRLPGIGEKTALRLTLHLLKQDKEKVAAFTGAVSQMRQGVKYCSLCKNISDTEICSICSNPRRDHSTVCLVESIREVIAIENTHGYNGVYHVLGGLISPVDGIGPEQLNIEELVIRVGSGVIKEIIMALSPTMEGDTTIFYISKRLAVFSDLQITTIARGVSIGGELEYTDELTLARSIAARQPYASLSYKS